MRKCRSCEKELPANEFYWYSKRRRKRMPKCKECVKSRARDNYRKNRKRYQEYERVRGKTEYRRRKALEYQAHRRRRYPQKYRARMAAGNAIRDGRLLRGPCEACGATEHVQAHHEDYSKPLEVRRLCREHHWQEHGRP